MSLRYWECGEVPDLMRGCANENLFDFVNENVLLALKWCWEDKPPNCGIEVEDGRMLLVVYGPEKPTEDDPQGGDIYSVEFDLLEMMNKFHGSGIKDAPREEARKLVARLRELADNIESMSAKADEGA